MTISTSNPDLMRAILAMDAYNRGYNSGIGPINGGLGGVGSQIGFATVIRQDGEAAAQAASFFAQAYTLGGKTIISYRGTDAPLDIATGWVTGAGAAGA